MPLHTLSRRRFDPADPLRRTALLWHRPGGMNDNPAAADVRLRPASGSDVSLAVAFADPLAPSGSMADSVVRVTVPGGTAAGSYTLVVEGTVTDQAVTVVAPPTRAAGVVVGPLPNWAAEVAAALAANRPVRLLPGHYPLAGRLALPVDALLRGDGAVVEVAAGGGFNLPTTGGVTLDGLAVRAADPLAPATLLHATGAAPDAVVSRCRLADLMVGPAAGLGDCDLLRTGWAPDGAAGQPAAAERCRWEGASRVQAAAVSGTSWPAGGLAVYDCSFHRTGRGTYFNTNAAAVRRTLVWFCSYADQGQGGNAAECHMAEGPGAYDDNLFGWARYTGCTNAAYVIWQCPAANNRAFRLYADGLPLGVVITPPAAGGGTVTGNRVEDSHIRARNPAAMGAFSYEGAAVDPENFPDPPADAVVFPGCTLVTAEFPFPVTPAHNPAGLVRRVNGAWAPFEVAADGTVQPEA